MTALDYLGLTFVAASALVLAVAVFRLGWSVNSLRGAIENQCQARRLIDVQGCE